MAKTVAQLIEELQKLPQNLEVLTSDCCYGLDDVSDPYIEKRSVDSMRLEESEFNKDRCEFKNYVIIN